MDNEIDPATSGLALYYTFDQGAESGMFVVPLKWILFTAKEQNEQMLL